MNILISREMLSISHEHVTSLYLREGFGKRFFFFFYLSGSAFYPLPLSVIEKKQGDSFFLFYFGLLTNYF